MEYLVYVSTPRVSASCLWVILFPTQKKGWVPALLMKELYWECGKNLNLRWHVLCLYFCFNPRVIKFPKKKIKNSNNNNKRKQARYVVRKYCEGFGHYWSLRDMLIYHRSGNTALKYFVRAWAWVIWRNLSWLCIQNRITVLNVSTS